MIYTIVSCSEPKASPGENIFAIIFFSVLILGLIGIYIWSQSDSSD